jgi:hypothetical protein
MKEKIKIKSYTLFDGKRNILKYHSFVFNEQQNKAINREIMKYRKNNGLKVID